MVKAIPTSAGHLCESPSSRLHYAPKKENSFPVLTLNPTHTSNNYNNNNNKEYSYSVLTTIANKIENILQNGADIQTERQRATK